MDEALDAGVDILLDIEPVGAMQVKFAAVVDSAQNIAGDYNSVKAAQELKTSEFEEAYAKYTESIPQAQLIEGETETLSYDFRYMDFGMTSDEVERAEQENYGLTTTATDWSVDYENVWFSPDLNGSLHYHLDDFRCVDYVRISLDPSVSQEDAYALVTSWYGSDFDGEAKVASDGERPEILVEVLTTGEESRFGSTDIYLAPEREVTTTLKLMAIKSIQLIKFRKKEEKEEKPKQ